MNYIDYLIHTANTELVRNFPSLLSNYVSDLPEIPPGPNNHPGQPGSAETARVLAKGMPALASISDSYPRDVVHNFIISQDTSVIDHAIQKHWFDINNSGPAGFTIAGTPVFKSEDAPPYHLIYAYLMENTRMYQIFEKLIFLYLNDEEIGVVSASNTDHQKAFQWIHNTESLFFKHLSNNNFRNITRQIRSNQEAVRRNAYYRLFAMDLAFESGGGGEYYKAKMANSEFIFLFEQFLTEVWQAYINAKNAVGANTTDYQKLVDMVTKLREILLARRGATGTIQLSQYRFMNLSREEYASVGLFSWLYNIISYDSPLIIFLGCQANTSAERLIKIGKKVKIEAHAKSQGLIDLSIPTATILRMIEFGTLEVPSWLQQSIESQTPTGAPIATTEQSLALVDMLTIINNWEKATGHRIKNPSANITGSVKVKSNGMVPAPVFN